MNDSSLEDRLRKHYAATAEAAQVSDITSLPWPAVSTVKAPSGFELVGLDGYVPPAVAARRPRARYVVAAAAVLLVAAGLVGVSKSGSRKTGTNSGSGPVNLLPSYVPNGFHMDSLGVSDLPSPQHVSVFRDTKDWPGQRSIAVTTNSQSYSPQAIEVNGRRLTTSGQNNAEVGLPNGVVIHLVGRGVAPDELRNLALTVSSRSDDPADGTDAAPAGLKVVHNATIRGPLSSADASWSTDQDGTLLTLTEVPDTASGIDGWLLDIDPTGATTPLEVSIRGQKGYLVPSRPEYQPPTTMLAWTEPSGLFITMGGQLSADTLMRIAGSLRPVEPAEWARLSNRSQMPVPTTAAFALTSVRGPGELAPPMALFAPSVAPNGYRIDGGGENEEMIGWSSIPGQRTMYRDAPGGSKQRVLVVAVNDGQPLIEARISDLDLFNAQPKRRVAEVSRSGVGPNGTLLRIAGIGFTEPELSAIIDGATTAAAQNDPAEGVLIPAGMVLVSNRQTRQPGRQSVVLLSPLDGSGHRINIRARSGVPTEIDEEMALEPSVIATAVRGHNGYRVTLPEVDTNVLVWMETPEIRVQIAGRGVPFATLQALAGSLTAVDAAQLTSRLAKPPPDTTPPVTK